MVKKSDNTKMGIAAHRYHDTGHVDVVMPKSDDKNDTGRNKVAIEERNCEFSDCVALVMLNSSSMRLLKPARNEHHEAFS